MKEEDEGARLGGRIGFSGSAGSGNSHLTQATHLIRVSRSFYSSGHPPRATQTCLPSSALVSHGYKLKMCSTLVINGCVGTSG